MSKEAHTLSPGIHYIVIQECEQHFLSAETHQPGGVTLKRSFELK